MNDNSVVQKQLVALKRKLDTAIETRSVLEEDFNTQTNLLVNFISKLSLVSKGVNLELDNRLAQLRTLFSKAAPLSDIESKITVINKLLQQHSITSEQNITQMHGQFISAGESLQKINGLPDDLRRKLRALLKEAKESKDALILYIPLLSQLLVFYDHALRAKRDLPKQGLLQAPTVISSELSTQQIQDGNSLASEHLSEIDATLIEKISNTLSELNLSQSHTNELLAIKKKLLKDQSSKQVLQHFLEIFDVIVADFQDEQNSAKNFLTTLSATLTTVQHAVKETLVTQKNLTLPMIKLIKNYKIN